VTFNAFIDVKSDAHNRPGSCACAKNTSFGGPASARQRLMCRCNVRNWLSAKRPG
jgi:hypothetical protein